MLRHSLRGCDDWRAQGLPIRSTTSNEACKLYDAAITQLCGLYDDTSFGGLGKTLSDMTKADPNFILGRSFALALEVLGVNQKVSPEVQNKLDELVKLVNMKKDSIDKREVKHVEALSHYARGQFNKAIGVWEEILSEYPTDMQAIKLSHGIYFDFGQQIQMRDSIARVLPHWTRKSIPLEGYLHGMYAFGLEETNFFKKAESEANLALYMNPFDGWATHAMSHIFETNGLIQNGIKFLSETYNNWEKSNFIACHNYWHLALYHIEKEDYDSAIHILDNHIIKRAEIMKRPGNIVDATSLLYRIELISPECGLVTEKRWQNVFDLVEPNLSNKRILGFIDSHFLMACLGAKKFDKVEEILENLRSYESSEQWLKTTLAITQAMVAFSEENYSKAVNLLIDVRYETQCMGGSNAQRDVFIQLLTVAALKSSIAWHKKLGQNLLNERLAQKNTPLINKLLKEYYLF
jgi:tetratricopeptide (TPR) repeat protein